MFFSSVCKTNVSFVKLRNLPVVSSLVKLTKVAMWINPKRVHSTYLVEPERSGWTSSVDPFPPGWSSAATRRPRIWWRWRHWWTRSPAIDRGTSASSSAGTWWSSIPLRSPAADGSTHSMCPSSAWHRAPAPQFVPLCRHNSTTVLDGCPISYDEDWTNRLLPRYSKITTKSSSLTEW